MAIGGFTGHPHRPDRRNDGLLGVVDGEVGDVESLGDLQLKVRDPGLVLACVVALVAWLQLAVVDAALPLARADEKAAVR